MQQGGAGGQLHNVSYHAVTRYVQRVLCVSAPSLPENADSLEEATAHCAAAGTTIDAVRDAIMTPVVVAAMRLKCPTVRGPGYKIVLSPDCTVVVTIAPIDQHRRSMIMERTEAKRRRRKTHIKRAGRPTALEYRSET